MSLDSLSTSHPIFVPVTSPDEINEIFDEISYHKVTCHQSSLITQDCNRAHFQGGSIIRMLNYTITDALLREGLHVSASYSVPFSCTQLAACLDLLGQVQVSKREP